jgi:hypothetical protein
MYTISPYHFILRDAPHDALNTEYHLRSGDYFAMIAGVLGFVEERLTTCDNTSRELVLLRQLRESLAEVRYSHTLVKKDIAKDDMPRTDNRTV